MKRLLLILLAFCGAVYAQQNALLLPWTPQQFTNTNGTVLANGKVCTYLAGTSTGVATYTDSTAATPNNIPPNAILLDSTGRPTSGGIWLKPTQAYKIIVLTAGSDSTCNTGVTIKTQDNVGISASVTANNTFTGTNAFTGAVTAKNINRTRMVDFANTSGWTGTDACAWINSAIADLAGNGGMVDARGLANGTSTCTSGTITIPSNITLLFSGAINTNASPGISVTANNLAGGIIGTGRANAIFTCTGNSVKCIDIGGSEVALRGFTLSDFKIATTGTTAHTLAIEDFAIHIAVQRMQLNPTGSCVLFVGGTQGFQFEDFQDIRCDGFSGVGFNANLVGNTGASNLQITNVYMNSSAATGGTIGFDIEKWTAVTVNSSDNDANVGPTGTPTGWKLAGVASVTGAMTLNSLHCENVSTVCVSIVGPGSYVFSAPSGISVAELIDINAVSNVTILNPWTNATSGTNDIIFEAASAGGQYLLVNPLYLSKPYTAAAGVAYSVFGNNVNGPILTVIGDEFANSQGLGLTNSHAGGHTWNFAEQFGLGRMSFRDNTAGGAISLATPTTAVEGILTASGITATRTYTLPDLSSGVPVSFSCGNTGSGNQTCTPSAASVKTQIYNGESTLAANAATITFPNGYTSVTSYFCVANDVTTRANPVQMVPASATTATITNTTGATDVIQWICIGQ